MLVTILIGLIIGAVARMLMPGKDPGGWVITILLGIGGSWIAHAIGIGAGWYSQDEPAGFLASIFGAILLLLVYRMIAGRRLVT